MALLTGVAGSAVFNELHLCPIFDSWRDVESPQGCMVEHIHELLHAAIAGLFAVSAISVLFEYRHLREELVRSYVALCLLSALYAGYVVISHNLPKQGAFWVPWTSFGLVMTFGASWAYLTTMQRFLRVRGRLILVARAVVGLITAVAVADLLVSVTAGRSMMFKAVPREGLSAHQYALGEAAYSLLPMADLVGGLFALGFALGVVAIVVDLIKVGSRDVLVFAGLIATSGMIINETMVALGAYAGVYLMGFTKALESVRIHHAIVVQARERVEARLRQAEKMEAIGRVAGGISHDFNNILQAVGTSVELAADALEDSHVAEEDLATALDSIDAGRCIVRQLLDVARSNDVSTEYIDVKEFLYASSGLLSAMVRGPAQLKVSADDHAGGVTLARGHLMQALMNLVVNASEAMPGGGLIAVEARTTSAVLDPSSSQHEQPAVRISVSDEGSGIPPEVLAHVFEPFFSTKREHGGTGLGLATLHTIITDAGGHVDVRSTAAEGTRFDLILPLAQGPGGAGEPLTDHTSASLPGQTHMR